MALEKDIRGLLADRNWDFISSYEFERSVVHLVHRKVATERKWRLQKTNFFESAGALLSLWKEFVGSFIAFHLLVPLSPLGKAPEIFGMGAWPWFFTVLPVSLFFSFVLGLILNKL